MLPKFKKSGNYTFSSAFICLLGIFLYVIDLFYILFKYNTIIYEIDERFGASSPVGRAK